jgi:hypothetical protein
VRTDLNPADECTKPLPLSRVSRLLCDVRRSGAPAPRVVASSDRCPARSAGPSRSSRSPCASGRSSRSAPACGPLGPDAELDADDVALDFVGPPGGVALAPAAVSSPQPLSGWPSDPPCPLVQAAGPVSAGPRSAVLSPSSGVLSPSAPVAPASAAPPFAGPAPLAPSVAPAGWSPDPPSLPALPLAAGLDSADPPASDRVLRDRSLLRAPARLIAECCARHRSPPRRRLAAGRHVSWSTPLTVVY